MHLLRRLSKASSFFCHALVSLVTATLFVFPSLAQTPEGDEQEIANSEGRVRWEVYPGNDGDFLLVRWFVDDNHDIENVFGQIFDASGTPLGDEFSIPDLPRRSFGGFGAALEENGFIWVWTVEGVPAQGVSYCVNSPTSLRMRRYSRQGVPSEEVQQIHQTATGIHANPSITFLSGGDFVVSWNRLTGEERDVDCCVANQMARRFEPGGTPLSDSLFLNTTSNHDNEQSKIVGLPDGGFSVLWDYWGGEGNFFDVALRSFDAASQPLTTFDTVVEDSPSSQLIGDLAVRLDGSLVVTWSSNGAVGTDSKEVLVRLFNPSGLPLGEEILVNTVTDGDQDQPKLAIGESGKVLVAYVDSEGGFEFTGGDRDGDSTGVFGQWLDSQGNLDGENFQVNALYQGPQLLRALVSSGDGVTAVWRSGPFFTGAAEVRSRRLASSCTLGPSTLCLGENGRFRTEVAWLAPNREEGQPREGQGGAEELSEESGYFWFFQPENIELVVKVIDGAAVNGQFWVFYGALSNISYQLTVTDTITGVQKVYRNPARHLASVGDTEAFPNDSQPALSIDPSFLAAQLPNPPRLNPLHLTPWAAPGSNSGPTLELRDARFAATLQWRDVQGRVGPGRAIPLTSDTGYFWFFNPQRAEVIVKVLDGRSVNGHFWVFYGSLSNVEFDLTIEDRLGSTQRTYSNPLRSFASAADIEAFP